MKKWIASPVLVLLACVLVPLVAACADDPPTKVGDNPAPSSSSAPPSTLTVPAGSTLHVRLTKTLTSKTSKTGDLFTGQVTEPITVNGQDVVPTGSLVDGHVAMVKPSGRIAGKAEMRIVLDHILTPDEVRISMAGSLEDAHGGPCASTAGDDEGTIKGCGKSKKNAAKDAAIAGAIGAGAGAHRSAWVTRSNANIMETAGVRVWERPSATARQSAPAPRCSTTSSNTRRKSFSSKGPI